MQLLQQYIVLKGLGVVIITTKRGKVGKSTLTINSQVGFENYRGDMELMNSNQFVQYMTEAGFLME